MLQERSGTDEANYSALWKQSPERLNLTENKEHVSHNIFVYCRHKGKQMKLSILFMALGGLILAAPALSAPAHVPAAPSGPVEIELSQKLDEERAERLESLIERFNSQHKDVHLKSVRRVDGDAPKQINLVTSVEHARFMADKAKFKPLYDVMHEAKQPLDTRQLSPELSHGLADAKGNLFALPVAYSTPVLYYNKAAFRKAGLNPEAPPKSWSEAQVAAGKLADSGSRCPFTTSWPAWVFIDNMSAWNGAPVSDAKGQLAFNGLVQVKHIAMMATWYKSKYFSYFGRRDEADRRFASGDCAMLTSSSSLNGSLTENKSLDFGVSAMPYHDDVRGAPQNTLADGASLWFANGMSSAETKAVAKFVHYVMGPEIQIELTLAGSFLPMTSVARTAAESKLLKANLAGLKVAYSELQGKASSPPVRIAQDEKLRTIVEEELETVWANKKPAKEALDNAVTRGNATIEPVVKVAKAKRGK